MLSNRCIPLLIKKCAQENCYLGKDALLSKTTITLCPDFLPEGCPYMQGLEKHYFAPKLTLVTNPFMILPTLAVPAIAADFHQALWVKGCSEYFLLSWLYCSDYTYKPCPVAVIRVLQTRKARLQSFVFSQCTKTKSTPTKLLLEMSMRKCSPELGQVDLTCITSAIN